MYSIGDLKTGTTIELNGTPYIVLEYRHSKLGRGGAILRTKLKNLISGNVIDKTFRGKEIIKPAILSKAKVQYLYKKKENYYFMNASNFEQFVLKSCQLGKATWFLKEGMNLYIQNYKSKPCNIEIPPKINLKVIKTEPGIKGDRVEGGTKPAEIETGFKLQVPLFVKVGNIIKVDTRTGRYVERVK